MPRTGLRILDLMTLNFASKPIQVREYRRIGRGTLGQRR
jgi:hypothetical protein